MDWRTTYAQRQSSAEDAAATIRSGQSLWIGMLQATPAAFAAALLARDAELRDVRVYHHVSPFPWSRARPGSIRHVTSFCTPLDRAAVRSGQADYLPFANFSRAHVESHHPPCDIAVVTLSPPDDAGYMSFGASLWLNGLICERAPRVYAEIDAAAIRTFGPNRIHASRIERWWNAEPASRVTVPPAVHPPAADAICGLVARELIRDGDCIQIGLGDVLLALPRHLEQHNDLGLHTEIITRGTLPLVQRGVITGRRKTVGAGKAVGSALLGLGPEELELAHLNPAVELWDFCDTDDIQQLVRNDGFKAINHALEVDLTGQVSAEGIGAEVYSGPGGQTVFAVAASVSRGGASVVVLPSTHADSQRVKSRIVPRFTAGTLVTIPRTFVDYVVTEHGIARLSGRTVRERSAALIEIAHPDFRAELRRASGLAAS